MGNKHSKIHLTTNAVVLRLRRKLLKDYRILRKQRGHSDMYAIVTDSFIGEYTSLEQLAKETGCLKSWETIEGGK